MIHRESVEKATGQAACDRWLEDHGDALYRYALARVRLSHVAEDLVQETLLAALHGAARFDGRSSVRTWLIGILRHKVLDYRRRQVASSEDGGEVAELGYFFKRRGSWKNPLGRWRCDPGELMESEEFRVVLDACLEKLPGRLAQLFLLREADEFSTEDICKETGVSATNVWSSLHRARLRLRECLSVHWFNTDGGR